MKLLLLALALSGSAAGLLWWSEDRPRTTAPPSQPASLSVADQDQLESLLRDAFCEALPSGDTFSTPQPLSPGIIPAPAVPGGQPFLYPPPDQPLPSIPQTPLLRPLPHRGSDTAPLDQVDRFLKWLSCQDWVVDVRAPFKEAEGQRALLILPSLPAQVPVEVDVRMADQRVQTYVVYLYVDASARARFAGIRKIERSE